MLKLTIRKDIDPKTFFPNEKYIIQYAFSVGDRHYFCFDDILNIPYQRGLSTLVYAKELDCNVDRAFIEQHCKAFDAVLTTSRFTTKQLLQLQTLNNQLMEKMAMPKEPDLMYKFAAVVYFDQKENPRHYEFKYGEEKIRHWKKNMGLNDFFLSQPLRALIPYLESVGDNLQTFSEMTTRVSAKHSANLSAALSGKANS